MDLFLRADESKCIAAGRCVEADPVLFDQSDDDGLVVLRASSVPPGRAESAREAVQMCPSGALTIEATAAP